MREKVAEGRMRGQHQLFPLTLTLSLREREFSKAFSVYLCVLCG
jgi:hypothetical protein